MYQYIVSLRLSMVQCVACASSTRHASARDCSNYKLRSREPAQTTDPQCPRADEVYNLTRQWLSGSSSLTTHFKPRLNLCGNGNVLKLQDILVNPKYGHPYQP